MGNERTKLMLVLEIVSLLYISSVQFCLFKAE